MKHQTSNAVIHACVLAAGTSSRFGSNKLIQNYRDRPLLQYSLLAAQGACPGAVTLVVGHDDKNVSSAAADLYNSIVYNEQHNQGLGTSIATAVRECRNNTDAILIILADQPLVTAQHLRAIIESWTGVEIIASSFDAVRSPPILFPQSTFDVLETLDADYGAKELLSNGDVPVKTIDFPPAKFDVDTPDDLRNLDQR